MEIGEWLLAAKNNFYLKQAGADITGQLQVRPVPYTIYHIPYTIYHEQGMTS